MARTPDERRGIEGEAVVLRHVQHGALGQRGDGEQRIDAERARNDRAVDDVEALVHGGRAAPWPGVEHLALVIDHAVAALAAHAAPPSGCAVAG